MNILISEDDSISRKILKTALLKKGHEVVETTNGKDALEALLSADAPRLAVLDWMMPGMDGIEVIRKIREDRSRPYVYTILLTAKCQQDEIAEGLDAGADDYLTKPFNPKELHARVRVGVRMIDLQNELNHNLEELRKALDQVKRLQTILPICSYCKKIRNDDNYWQQVEEYMSAYTEAKFSHSICPDCYERVVLPELEAMDERQKDRGEKNETHRHVSDMDPD
ncbi:response regulator [bacterium]|nr:response regulator [bacterium]